MRAVSWGELEREDVALAAFGQERLDGKVAYLATTRKDGRPRAHPVTPVIGEGHMFIFLEPSSPRTRDLIENPDYCLHCAMSDSSGSSGEFQVTGIARHSEDAGLRELAESISNFRPSTRSLLFELTITEALSTAYLGGQPKRRRWQSSAAVAES
ncbi:MAG: pyridoxamine 5'-phosphate oxidase family protein [Proteobacteria bacterium]|nr:pyridoxamine 5'-phosphate oxidase family protein [Pseudomonadota bacterium]